MTDVTLPLEIVDAKLAPFFQAVGKAIIRWQHVEMGLFVVTHATLGTDSKLSSVVFYHIQSPDSKIQLTDRLCRASLAGAAIDEWGGLSKRLSAAIPFRNALAHWEASFVTDLSWLEPDEPPVALTRHHLDGRSQADRRAVTMTTANKVAEEYLDLANRLMQFAAGHFSLERLRTTHLPPRLLRHLARFQTAPPGLPQQPQSSPG